MLLGACESVQASFFLTCLSDSQCNREPSASAYTLLLVVSTAGRRRDVGDESTIVNTVLAAASGF